VNVTNVLPPSIRKETHASATPIQQSNSSTKQPVCVPILTKQSVLKANTTKAITLVETALRTVLLATFWLGSVTNVSQANIPSINPKVKLHTAHAPMASTGMKLRMTATTATPTS